MLTGMLTRMGSLSGTLNTGGTLTGSVSSSTVQGKINNSTLQGLSAYEIAVKHGFVGTEEEWLATLTVEYATDVIPGIMKLYDYTGDNTDGTMTQRAITNEIRDNASTNIPADDIFEIIYN